MPVKPRKKHMKRASESIKDIPSWKLSYILTGSDTSSKAILELSKKENISPMEIFSFMWALPGERPWWGRALPWFLLWSKIKDTPVVRDFERQRGQCYASQRFEEYIKQYPYWKKRALAQINEM